MTEGRPFSQLLSRPVRLSHIPNVPLQPAMLPSSVNACLSYDNTTLVPGLHPQTFDYEFQPLLEI